MQLISYLIIVIFTSHMSVSVYIVYIKENKQKNKQIHISIIIVAEMSRK